MKKLLSKIRSVMLLFLGAGASAPFGIPTMPNFIKLLDQKLDQSRIYEDIKEVFGDDCDLEVLMTIIEDLSKPREELLISISPQTAGFLLEKNKEEVESYMNKKTRDIASDLLDKIKNIVRNECITAASEDARIVDVYDDFFNCLSEVRVLIDRAKVIGEWGGAQIGHTKMILPEPLNIFTTNYDTCPEVYFNRKQINFTNGIINQYGEDILDVESYLGPLAKSIKIFKLHGSIDLFHSRGRIRQLKAAGKEKTFLGDECGEYSIRWPIEFGGYRHVIESPYLDLFRLLRDNAKDDNWWIIIGFSFRDRTICSVLNDLLALMAQRDRPHAILIDPSPNPIIQRLKKWSYNALANILCPAEVEFGAKDLSAQIHKNLANRGYIKEAQISTGKVRY